jgi:hypothetical protein
MKYWEIIADRLSQAGWSLGWVSAIDSHGQTIWIVDAHRDGKRFVERADEKLSAFIDPKTVVRCRCRRLEPVFMCALEASPSLDAPFQLEGLRHRQSLTLIRILTHIVWPLASSDTAENGRTCQEGRPTGAEAAAPELMVSGREIHACRPIFFCYQSCQVFVLTDLTLAIGIATI